MTKKLLLLGLILILALGCLTACGGGAEDNDPLDGPIPDDPLADLLVSYDPAMTDSDWREVAVVDDGSDSTCLLHLTKQLSDGTAGDIAVWFELMPEGTQDIYMYGEYVMGEADPQAERFGPYDWTANWGAEGVFYRQSGYDDVPDETVYITAYEGGGVRIHCTTIGPLEDGLINEFEGIFLDEQLTISLQ